MLSLLKIEENAQSIFKSAGQIYQYGYKRQNYLIRSVNKWSRDSSRFTEIHPVHMSMYKSKKKKFILTIISEYIYALWDSGIVNYCCAMMIFKIISGGMVVWTDSISRRTVRKNLNSDHANNKRLFNILCESRFGT